MKQAMRVIDRFRRGQTISRALDALGRPSRAGDAAGSLLTQGAIEAAVLDLLDDRPSAEEAA